MLRFLLIARTRARRINPSKPYARWAVGHQVMPVGRTMQVDPADPARQHDRARNVIFFLGSNIFFYKKNSQILQCWEIFSSMNQPDELNSLHGAMSLSIPAVYPAAS